MTKSQFSDWDTTAANNSDINDIPLAESQMRVHHTNNAIREVMAQLRTSIEPGAQVNNFSGTTGGNDNRILRADGTGGATLQASSAVIDDSGNMTITGNCAVAKTWPALLLNKPAAGTGAELKGQTNGLTRWNVALGNNAAESGSNVGSNYVISRYDDAGTWIEDVLTIRRSTGYVGVGPGATNPDYALTVNAEVKFGSNIHLGDGSAARTTGDFYWDAGYGNGAKGHHFRQGTGLTEYIQVNNAYASFPNVGTTASGGNAYLNSGSGERLMRSTSSMKYKRDAEPLEKSYSDALMSITPIWYRSKCEADDPNWSWYGFSAEEVAAIDPRMVQWGYGPDDYEHVEVEITVATEDGPQPAKATDTRLKAGAEMSPQGVSYDRFVVHHHALIKDMQAQIAALTAQVEALTARAAKA